MPFQLNYASTFGPIFDQAYAQIIGSSYERGGNIQIRVGIYADKAAADANMNPLEQFIVTIPPAEGLSLMPALYDLVSSQIATGDVPQLADAITVA